MTDRGGGGGRRTKLCANEERLITREGWPVICHVGVSLF
mgnify:CR=1 FL=1